MRSPMLSTLSATLLSTITARAPEWLMRYSSSSSVLRHETETAPPPSRDMAACASRSSPRLCIRRIAESPRLRPWWWCSPAASRSMRASRSRKVRRRASETSASRSGWVAAEMRTRVAGPVAPRMRSRAIVGRAPGGIPQTMPFFQSALVKTAARSRAPSEESMSARRIFVTGRLHQVGSHGSRSTRVGSQSGIAENIHRSGNNTS